MQSFVFADAIRFRLATQHALLECHGVRDHHGCDCQHLAACRSLPVTIHR